MLFELPQTLFPGIWDAPGVNSFLKDFEFFSRLSAERSALEFRAFSPDFLTPSPANRRFLGAELDPGLGNPLLPKNHPRGGRSAGPAPTGVKIDGSALIGIPDKSSYPELLIFNSSKLSTIPTPKLGELWGRKGLDLGQS